MLYAAFALLATGHLVFTLIRAVYLGLARRADYQAAVPPDGAAANVSLVIPAWNDAGVLERTLVALDREARAFPARLEVFIVAGGKDGTFEAATALLGGRGAAAWRLLPQQPHGKNAALNQALIFARYDVVVLLDADTEVQEGWLTALTAPLARGDADATTGNFSAYRTGDVSMLFELDQLVTQVIDRRNTLFGGGSIGLSRAALRAIGGTLPEDVVVGVDWDLSERVRALGLKRAFVETARVKTELPRTWHDYWRAEVRWRRAFYAAELRHLRQDGAPNRLIGLVYLPAVQALLLAGWLVLPLLSRLAGHSVLFGLAIYLGFAVWLLGRHCARCLEAYAFSRERRWLSLVPSYGLSFCVSAAAAWRALLTLGALNPHFKGRRATQTL